MTRIALVRIVSKAKNNFSIMFSNHFAITYSITFSIFCKHFFQSLFCNHFFQSFFVIFFHHFSNLVCVFLPNHFFQSFFVSLFFASFSAIAHIFWFLVVLFCGIVFVVCVVVFLDVVLCFSFLSVRVFLRVFAFDCGCCWLSEIDSKSDFKFLVSGDGSTPVVFFQSMFASLFSFLFFFSISFFNLFSFTFSSVTSFFFVHFLLHSLFSFTFSIRFVQNHSLIFLTFLASFLAINHFQVGLLPCVFCVSAVFFVFLS